MATLFISDLHLDAARPDITEQFLAFLNGDAREAHALYILGDLFEAWIGDDDPAPDKRLIVSALQRFTASKRACYVMHGNRDFLLGSRFANETGVRLIPDGSVIDLYGRPVLLLHGDTLCTDDHDYQRLRRIVRNPLVQFVMRRLSLAQRQRLAERMRAGSKAHIAAMDRHAPTIMDVNAGEVASTFRRYGVDCMIHGHTHRPAVHEMNIEGQRATRIVLGDWFDQGSVLRWNESGFELLTLRR